MRAASSSSIWRRHGLSAVLAGLFLITWLGGQFFTGKADNNQERVEHGLPPLGVAGYFLSAHFLEATAENWESEFFQMGIFVIITVHLFQKGSAESKDPDSKESLSALTKHSPWAARRGGWVRPLYSHSLSSALLFLFVVSMWLHAVGGHALYNEELARDGHAPISIGEFVESPRFWFQSFQNWQSEFLSLLCMVVFTIFLRERGSPESKPVNAPHAENG